MKRSCIVLSGIAGLALALTACAQTAPPTYEEVRSETEDAMQLIVDTLPPGTPLEDRSGEPFACDLEDGGLLSGEGQFFTGLWTLYPSDDFDGKTYVANLPEALGDDFVVDGNVVDVSFPVVRLRPANAPDVVIDVTTNSEGDEPLVDIRAVSRCGSTTKS